MEDPMSSAATTPVIRAPSEGTGTEEITLAGQPMVFLVTGEHSRHTSMFEWTVPAGFATGLHVHRVQEEAFYMLEGECEWRVGDRVVRATPGTYLFVPPGVAHNIANPGDRPARVLMTVSPPGHEHYFRKLAELTARGQPRDANAIGELRARHDTDQLSALTKGS
ncbi:MAG: cupin domain-containing protein [Proteobacteria bacterium]|nr:cupin domain-containing protein [Pseudomonadota bacterium]